VDRYGSLKHHLGPRVAHGRFGGAVPGGKDIIDLARTNFNGKFVFFLSRSIPAGFERRSFGDPAQYSLMEAIAGQCQSGLISELLYKMTGGAEQTYPLVRLAG